MPRKTEVVEQLRELLRKNINGEDLSLEEIEETIMIIKDLEEDVSQMEFAPDVGSLDGQFDFEEGDVVRDESPPSFVTKANIPNEFRVIEVTSERASDVVASPAEDNPENQDRTVADLNPGYSEDDIVVKVSPVDRDKVYSYPASRLSPKEKVEA